MTCCSTRMKLWVEQLWGGDQELDCGHTKLQVSVRNASPYPVDLRGEFGWRVSKATRLGLILQGVNVHRKSTQRRRRGETARDTKGEGEVGEIEVYFLYHFQFSTSFSCSFFEL